MALLPSTLGWRTVVFFMVWTAWMSRETSTVGRAPLGGGGGGSPLPRPCGVGLPAASTAYSIRLFSQKRMPLTHGCRLPPDMPVPRIDPNCLAAAKATLSPVEFARDPCVYRCVVLCCVCPGNGCSCTAVLGSGLVGGGVTKFTKTV